MAAFHSDIYVVAPLHQTQYEAATTEQTPPPMGAELSENEHLA